MNSFTSDKLAQIFMSLEMYSGSYVSIFCGVHMMHMFTLLIIIHVFHILIKHVFPIVLSEYSYIFKFGKPGPMLDNLLDIISNLTFYMHVQVVEAGLL